MKLWNARRPLGICRNGRWTTDSKGDENIHLWARDRKEAESVARQHWGDNGVYCTVRTQRLTCNINLCHIPEEACIFNSREHYRGTYNQPKEVPNGNA